MTLVPVPWHPRRAAPTDPRMRRCTVCGSLVYTAAMNTVLSRHADSDHQCPGNRERVR